MRRLHTLPYVLLATLCLAVQLPTARAGISYTGEIDPADPADWDSSTNGFVGKNADGTLIVDAGSDLFSRYVNIGYSSGLTGEVTVDGAGSSWTSSRNLYVGRFGSGMLNITDSGTVSVEQATYLAYEGGSTGTINFDGGTLSTKSLWASVNQLLGTGTINTRGLVIDTDLHFDSTHSHNQVLTLNSHPGQNITVNLNIWTFAN